MERRIFSLEFIFGIWEEDDNFYETDDPFDIDGIKKKSIGFISSAAYITANPGDYGKACGKICKDGDVVEMILDFDTLQLRYCINGKDYGIADAIDDDATYRAVVMLRGESSVELL